MSSRFPDDAPAEPPGSRRPLIIAGIGIIAVFVVLNDLVGWIEGGGIFSILSAIRAVHQGARVIDVDSAGLRSLFLAGCSLVVTGIAIQLNADFAKRLTQFAIMMPIVGGGFLLDAVYDETLVQNYMNDHGYSRCAARDHVEGHGKGRVWFDNYVRGGADCPFDPKVAPIYLPNDPRRELPRPARSIGSPAAWFRPDDYPPSALQQGLTGSVKVRFFVNKDGRIKGCHTIVSSGSEELDSATCMVLATEAHYWPARDAAGKPIAQFGTFKARWTIPAE